MPLWGSGDTLARCVWRLLLASAVSEVRLEKATLTLLNWFHISPLVVVMRISISSLSLWEAARSLCERRTLSSVNLDQDSGSESLGEGKTSDSSHRPRTHRGNNLLSIL